MFLACSDSQKAQGPAEMHWDRDMCARCVMVISDRKNSVQVEDTATKKVYKFDDLGCMAIWAKEGALDLKKAKVWVTDAQTGEWIDAKTAVYTAGNTTPMGYGFSAFKSKSELKDGEDTLSFDEVYNDIIK
jgi:nitrous oxide reductase accessory protein NosL